MRRRISSSLAGAALLVLAGQAAADCEDMRVEVRNSLYEIRGLDAFCAEFKQMRAELAELERALANARAENARLNAGLAAMPARARAARVASIGPHAHREAKITEE